MNINIPKGLWDSIFLTLQRKVMTGACLLAFGGGLMILGTVVLYLPTQDYDQVRGRICMTNDGFTFIPLDEKETKHD